MKYDEMKAYNVVVTSECADYICGQEQLAFEAYATEDVDTAIAELKAKLESVQATAYAESVDEGMENRKLKRALWLALGAVHKAKAQHEKFLIRSYPQWEGTPAGLKTHKQIAKYENYERKCRAKAEEYK